MPTTGKNDPPQIVKIGKYNVTRADDWYGLRVWAMFFGGKIQIFHYFGADLEAGHYFFRQRGEHELIIGYPLQQINTTFFKPFLLELDKIREEGPA